MQMENRQMKQRYIVSAILAIALIMMTASAGWGAVPRMISYQGKATDVSGNPVPDGDYQVRFFIYDHPTAGNSLWGEMSFTVHTTNGLFSYLLGSHSPIPDSVFAKYDSLYLAVTFNYELQTPRTPLVSAGYAFRVNSVDGATGGTITGKITIGGATDCWIDPNATGYNSVNLPDGAINDREINDEPGIAQGVATSTVAFGSGGVCSDLVTVDITIPTSGYIVLFGKVRVDISANSTALVQIDETAGGVIDDVSSVWHASRPDGSQKATLVCHRVYYRMFGGTYTFRLEGMSSLAYIPGYDPVLTAMFIPTSYGSVETLMSAADAQNVESVDLPAANGKDRIKVDLRALELKAAKAEAEAEKAKADLLRARRGASAGTNNQTNTAIGK